MATHVAAAEAMLGGRKAEVDRALDLLAPLRATAYAAWNDLLLADQSPNDRAIIREARHNRHESKTKISDGQ